MTYIFRTIQRALGTALFLSFLGVAPIFAQSLPDDIDISTSSNGVVPLPGTVSPVFTNLFDRYTKIVAPNGQAIHFLLQTNVTDQMAVRAREIMRFYLTDAPGSQYGATKTALMNRMGNVEATLVYFNTEQAAFSAFNGPLGSTNLFFQDLYATESVVEGSNKYKNNTVRDATLEEVFHLVHGAGIQPILPAYHAELTAAMNAAKASGDYIPPGGLPPQDEVFEYIISVIDVYYGFWAHDPDGNGTSFGGEYAFHTRAAVKSGDPIGVRAMLKFLPPSLEAFLKVAPGFTGTFTLTFDASTEYTLKSQYLRNVGLSGSTGAALTGNALDNELHGNSGNNAIDGANGVDTATFQGDLAEYSIQCDSSGIQVTDTVSGRDGTDSLTSIESLSFRDQVVQASSLCPPAGKVIRNGSGLNPVDYTSTLPILNNTWVGTVDTTLHLSAFNTVIVGQSAPTPGTVFGFGELLIDLGSAMVFQSVAAPLAGIATHSAPIPNDIALLGLVVYTQAVVLGSGSVLCNAIDLTIGF